MGENVQAEESDNSAVEVQLSQIGVPIKLLEFGKVAQWGIKYLQLWEKILGHTDSIPTVGQINKLYQQLQAMQKNRNKIYSTVLADMITIRAHVAFTILVPAGKADRAWLGVDELRKLSMLDTTAYQTYKDSQYAKVIRPYARFHKTKAGRLRIALGRMDSLIAYMSLAHKETKDTALLRRSWYNGIIAIPGFGYKATAHLMRNM